MLRCLERYRENQPKKLETRKHIPGNFNINKMEKLFDRLFFRFFFFCIVELRRISSKIFLSHRKIKLYIIVYWYLNYIDNFFFTYFLNILFYRVWKQFFVVLKNEELIFYSNEKDARSVSLSYFFFKYCRHPSY